MEYKYFKILKGCHFSNFIPCIKLVKNIRLEKLSQRVTFDESCVYSIKEKSCVNKLFGFCIGFGVHKNSVRFGWACNNETQEIDIYTYIYSNGILKKRKICSVSPYSTNDFEICYLYDDILGSYSIEMYMNDNCLLMFQLKSSVKFITTLGFYFGGKSRAPHTMRIKSMLN